jgi:hypothetical protein
LNFAWAKAASKGRLESVKYLVKKGANDLNYALNEASALDNIM